MSKEERPVITRRNERGVLLHYYAHRLPPSSPKATDRERVILKNADKALRVLDIIIEGLEPSLLGFERAIEAMRRIEVALALVRDRIGE